MCNQLIVNFIWLNLILFCSQSHWIWISFGFPKRKAGIHFDKMWFSRGAIKIRGWTTSWNLDRRKFAFCNLNFQGYFSFLFFSFHLWNQISRWPKAPLLLLRTTHALERFTWWNSPNCKKFHQFNPCFLNIVIRVFCVEEYRVFYVED